MKLSMAKCQKKLVLLWFIGAAILFIILIAQSYGKFYGAKVDEAWSWFLPAIMPTLSLTLGVIIYDYMGQTTMSKSVDSLLFRLTFTLSFFYIIAIALTLVISPFLNYTVFELMKTSNYWLAPLQGLVSVSIGIFFIKKEA